MILFKPDHRYALANQFLSIKPQIAIVSGGSSDAAVCHEVAVTFNYHGIACDLYEDIGVAGLWWLTGKIDEIKKSKLIILKR